MLADDGVYLASESTFSRVLRDEGQAAHRGRAKKPRTVRPPTTESTDGLQHVEYTGALDAGYMSVIIEFDGLMIEVDDGWLDRFDGSAALERA